MPTVLQIASSIEVGSLGVFHLKRLWGKILLRRQGLPSDQDYSAEWIWDQTVIHGLGLLLEDTMQYLYNTVPTYEEFEQWVLAVNNGTIDPARIEGINSLINGMNPPGDDGKSDAAGAADEAVLNERDLAFWEEHGYVIVKGAVSPENCRAAEAAIWQHLAMDPQNPETWYAPRTHGIMVQFFHHPALEANRRAPRIHKAFSQIWQRNDLWVTTDRVSFNCAPANQAQ